LFSAIILPFDQAPSIVGAALVPALKPAYSQTHQFFAE
jgi:hypothetical protein